MSEPTSVDEFARAYISAWSTTDAQQRRSLINQLYAEDADFYADEPGDAAVHRHGRDEIEHNIRQVNERLTQANGLSTESTGFTENHDLLGVSWKMTSPDGATAMTGMNLLLRNADGQIMRDYIVIG